MGKTWMQFNTAFQHKIDITSNNCKFKTLFRNWRYEFDTILGEPIYVWILSKIMLSNNNNKLFMAEINDQERDFYEWMPAEQV